MKLAIEYQHGAAGAWTQINPHLLQCCMNTKLTAPSRHPQGSLATLVPLEPLSLCLRHVAVRCFGYSRRDISYDDTPPLRIGVTLRIG